MSVYIKTGDVYKKTAIGPTGPQSIEGPLSVDNGIGVGISTPTQKLDVVGAIQAKYDDTKYIKIHHDGTNPRVTSESGGLVLSASNGFVYTATNTSLYIQADGKLYSNTIRGHSGGDLAIQDEAGNVGIGTDSPTEKLDIDSDTIRLRTSKSPASSSDTGEAGTICWDNNYIYVCVATNTWKRAPLSTW